MNNISIIVLAAGKGTRMKSDLPKVLHTICGYPMITYVLDAINGIKSDKKIVVIGEQENLVRKNLEENKDLTFVSQKKQLGTGHAVKQVEKEFKNYSGDILVVCGDTPLLKTETLKKIITSHKRTKSDVTILSCILDNPYGYGRIIKENNKIVKIVEEKDSNKNEKLVREINTGIYCFNSAKLFSSLKNLKADNKQNELYLTDVIEMFFNKKYKINSVVSENSTEIMGINNRYELSIANNYIKNSILKEWMLNGVTIVNPETTFIDKNVKLEKDVIVYPFTIIEGKSIIKAHSKIGPYSYVSNSILGKNVEILNSTVRKSKIDNDVRVGPYSNIRPNTILSEKVKVGNFCELKKVNVGKESKISHLSYIGDAVLGQNVNIGAGTITCNYDGINKHITTIEDNAFIGSNSNLIAPVKIGKDSIVAAGSTINKDVPAEGLGIARNKQMNIKRYRRIKK